MSGGTAPAAWPAQLTPELRKLLGFMCFELGPIAHAYAAAGEYGGIEPPLQKRAEDEQAFVLHRWIGYWFEDPATWHEKATHDLARLQAKRARPA